MQNSSVAEPENSVPVDQENCEFKPEAILHQFYYVKFNRNFIDPSLEARIERLEILKECIVQQKNSIINEIESLKEKIAEFDKEVNSPYYPYRYSDCRMSYCYKEIAKYWPECVDEDPEEAIDPYWEKAKIELRIESLRHELGHGNHKIGEQKLLLKDLKRMQDRKEELELQIKRGEVHIPLNEWQLKYNRRYNIDQGVSTETVSKFILQRDIRCSLRKKREFEEAREQKKEEEWKKKIREAEKRLSFINQKEARVCNRILMAENKLNLQISCYDGYTALKKKVNKLATEKDVVALEHLSSLQVEGFMQRWTREDEFRANYNRKVRTIDLD